MNTDLLPLPDSGTASNSTPFPVSPEDRILALLGTHPWMEPGRIAERAESILDMNASYRAKRSKLLKLADEFNQALRTQSTCRNGCNYCCFMTTFVYRYEAVLLATVSGRSMVELPYRPREVVIVEGPESYGKACPFLVAGRCSVYAHRPMICRLHHSLNNDPRDCSTSPPHSIRKQLFVIDPDCVEVSYHRLMLSHRPQEPWGAITEFFPV